MRKIVIGIQARSTSTRLPNKIHMRLNGKAILQWVIDACQKAEKYLLPEYKKLEAQSITCVLTPKEDVTVKLYGSTLPVLQGAEDDVLSRYADAVKHFGADYIIRITSDCVFIPSHLIAKHIKAALIRGCDYTTNTHIRTWKEGFDCEVLSRRLVEWLDKNASEPTDREHVTTLIAKEKPFPFRDRGKASICHILSPLDESNEKTSIDTLEDFKRAEELLNRFRRARWEAKKTGVPFV